jgi:hypothetical protein
MAVCRRDDERSTAKVSTAGASSSSATTAPLEVLLADDELEDVGGQHVEVAADHLGDAEVGDDQREDHQAGRDQAVLGARQRDGEELARSVVPIASAASYRRASASDSAVTRIISACGKTAKHSATTMPGAP